MFISASFSIHAGKLGRRLGTRPYTALYGDEPLMLVTNGSMALDVYDLQTDKKVRTIGGFAAAMPLVLHAFESGK